jgi:hypothetical protein
MKNKGVRGMRGLEILAGRGAAALSGAVVLATVADRLRHDGPGDPGPGQARARRVPGRAPGAARGPAGLQPSAAWPGGPSEGGRGGGEPDSSDEAAELLTGSGSGGGEERQVASLGAEASQGERALVQSSPVRADPEVRSRIVTDSGELTRIDQRLFFMILDFQRGQFGRGDEVLDPAAEAARLRTRGQTGVVTVRTGSTPLPAP